MSIVFARQQTTNKKGVRVSSYATDYVYSGNCFSVSQNITVTAGTNALIVWDITPSATAGKSVSVYPPSFTTTAGPLTVDIYAGTDYTGSTSMLINNRAYYGDNATATLKTGGTGTDKGDLFTQFLVPSGKKQSGSVADVLEFVPTQNVKYLIEIDNTDNNDAVVNVSFVWFEV